ncbi:type II secretion system F family protein [Pseudokineococcus basanitobsidens]|uniref:Type II secretion system F family protein n=1 Tax=Pseudokineococcus basanitobsidens TaxID=1926649 RepID=A0ABU8RM53_9ACTN
MGALVGLVGGAGLFCTWWACWAPDERPRPPRRRSRRGEALRDELVQADMRGVSPAALATAAAVCALLVGLGVLAVSGSPVVAAAFAVIAAVGPRTLVRARARARRTSTREQWPEAVDHLTSGIRAGLSLPEAVAQLSVRGPVELRPAFAAFAEDYRATGRFGDCLDRLKESLADPVADRIVESLRLTREVGGSDLGRLLRTLSAFLREDARTRSELEARQSWTVNGARLAVAAPWLVLALLASRPEAVDAYDTPTGALVLAVGGAASVVAYRLMVRLGRLPDEARVLR